jgi:hypothetical protein
VSEGAGVSKQAVTSKWRDLGRRLGLGVGWVAVQYWATALIILAGIGWTRLPDKHAWQVGLTLLIPLLLLAAFLLLEAGTMRKLAQDESGRVGIIHGALTLLVWIAMGCLAWAILDWCDDQTFLWAGYLNSKAPAHLRAMLFSYSHIQLWITTLIWIFRWIALPAKVIPHAVASAQQGWRLPWRRSLRLVLDWRWWIAVAVAALVGVALPVHFFSALPSGTVSHQVWAVGIKLAGAYLLAITSWVMVLAWAAVLMGIETPHAAEELIERLFACLRSSRKWIVGCAGWIAISWLFDFAMDALPERLNTSGWIVAPAALILILAALILQVGMIRAMTHEEEKKVRPVWAVLSVLVWLAVAVGIWFLRSHWHHEIAGWVVDWIVIPALVVPLVASSGRWGLKLPWRRVLGFMYDWRWWVGVVLAVIVGAGLSDLIKSIATGGKASQTAWMNTFWNDIPDLFTYAAWIVLMGWFAVLVAHAKTHTKPIVDSSVPEPGNDISGNA